MHIVTYNYRFADEILNSRLDVKNEILDVLRDIRVPESGISTRDLNSTIRTRLEALGWQSQVSVFGGRGEGETRFDFMKSRVGVEVQFGHASFIGIDLLKFQVGSYSGVDKIDVGIYVMATKEFLKEMEERGRKWSGRLTFEKATRYLPFVRSAIHVPILVVGLS